MCRSRSAARLSNAPSLMSSRKHPGALLVAAAEQPAAIVIMRRRLALALIIMLMRHASPYGRLRHPFANDRKKHAVLPMAMTATCNQELNRLFHVAASAANQQRNTRLSVVAAPLRDPSRPASIQCEVGDITDEFAHIVGFVGIAITQSCAVGASIRTRGGWKRAA